MILKSPINVNPQKNTILIFCYKYKSFDKRSKLYKAAKKNGVVYESRELYDSEIKKWLGFEIKKNKLDIDQSSIEILYNSIGNDLSKIMMVTALVMQVIVMMIMMALLMM